MICHDHGTGKEPTWSHRNRSKDGTGIQGNAKCGKDEIYQWLAAVRMVLQYVVAKQNPGRTPVRAGEVGSAGVDTNHKIERSETRDRFVEVGKIGNQIDDLVPFNEDRLVFGSRLLLQTDESCIDIQDGRGCETTLIGCDHCPGLPDQSRPIRTLPRERRCFGKLVGALFSRVAFVPDPALASVVPQYAQCF